MTGFNSICSFSQDAGMFAFQPANQKDIINLYPLDAVDGYKARSTLIKTIDYEKDDLSLEDIEGITWICSASENGTKRKLDGKELSSNGASNVNVFVNCFSQGKLVFYENNQIVNIIKNKHEVIGLKTFGKYLWILDSDKTVKQFSYDSTKPVKTFHLTDGRSDDILLFDILKVDENTMRLAVVTEKNVYIVDPSKRRPTTLETFEIFGCVGIKMIGNKYVIADLNSIKVFENRKVDREWAFESERLDVWGSNKIIATAVDGTLSVFDLDSDIQTSKISVENSEIIDSVVLANGKLIVAWLDVNEPKFDILEESNLRSNLVISNKQDNGLNSEKHVEEEELVLEEVPQKASRKEKKDIFESLINAFTENQKMDKIIKIIESDKWNEAMIKKFVSTEINKTNSIGIYESLSKHVSQNPWNDNHNCSLFLKWILILFNVHVSKKVSSTISKTNKNLKHSLASTSATLPLLLSIQGKVEMLIAQAELRKEMDGLLIGADEEDNEPEDDEDDEEDDDEENMHYIDGEENDDVDEA